MMVRIGQMSQFNPEGDAWVCNINTISIDVENLKLKKNALKVANAKLTDKIASLECCQRLFIIRRVTSRFNMGRHFEFMERQGPSDRR